MGAPSGWNRRFLSEDTRLGLRISFPPSFLFGIYPLVATTLLLAETRTRVVKVYASDDTRGPRPAAPMLARL